MTNTAKPNWKKLLELLAAICTLVASFVGGQAAAQNDVIDIFDKYEQTK